MKPIQKAFKLVSATVCLANEWRDTILFTATILFGEFLALKVDPVIGTGVALFLMGCREAARTLEEGYVKPRQLRVVGDVSSPVDHRKNAAASLLVATSLILAAVVLSYGSDKTNKLDLLAATVLGVIGLRIAYPLLSARGGRLRDIPNLYFDKETGMWDSPRKNKNKKGPPQTQKVKDAFKKAFSSLGKRLVPQSAHPSARAVLVPVRVRNFYKKATPSA